MRCGMANRAMVSIGGFNAEFGTSPLAAVYDTVKGLQQTGQSSI
jgi:hypothetical protein